MEKNIDPLSKKDSLRVARYMDKHLVQCFCAIFLLYFAIKLVVNALLSWLGWGHWDPIESFVWAFVMAGPFTYVLRQSIQKRLDKEARKALINPPKPA